MTERGQAGMLLVVGALAAAFPAASQPDFDKIEMQAVPVAGAVHMLQGLGGNIGVSVGEDGILIVDDQFAPLADKIRAALASLGEGRLRFILNTHWHSDHTGANPVFGPEAPILAHHNVRQRLMRSQEIHGQTNPPMAKEGLPVITFDQEISVHFNGEEIRAVHLPRGHTDGDSAIFFTASNVVHMGDHYFAGRFPFVDLASGGDVEGYAANIRRVLAEIPPDARVIPGHGPLSTVEELRRYQRMLEETIAVVRDGIASGQQLDELKERGFPDPWGSGDWGAGWITEEVWIETIHASLTRGGR